MFAYEAEINRIRDRLSQGLTAASLVLVAAALADSQEAMAFVWPKQEAEARNGHLVDGAVPQPSIPRLVDAALELSLQTPPLAEAGLSARLLEAVCEAVPVQQCSGVFACLESRIAIFQRPALRARVAQTVLRTANAALRRLSKSQSAMAGGKILLFLARFNPLADRSGTNFQGLYNAENATPVEELGEAAPLDHEGRPVDPAFYKTFWGLQELFARPPSALAPGGWERARRGLDAVLGWLEAHPLAEGREAPPGSSLGISVKFLSTARLLHLELEDLTFRRHV
ncbi:THO complex subunit 1 transcription elongation factor, partial [Helicosporidium sp. ATCC 50920]